MRRFFVLFLLLLLPFQFAIAAAAPYCALEKVDVESHFGHHEHPDASAPEPADDGGEKWKLDDCGICHFGSGQIHLSVASIPALPRVGTLRAMPDGRQPQHLQEPTDRPPRTSLA